MGVNKNEINEVVQGIMEDARYNVSKVPYHLHNNTDSPFVPFNNIANAPNQFCVATSTNGGTTVNVLGRNGASFNATITGMFLIASDTTAGNITLKNNGNTVATVAKGTTSGGMVGATSVTNTSYSKGRSCTLASDSAGNATVFVTFTV